jgi:hypothetical protein
MKGVKQANSPSAFITYRSWARLVLQRATPNHFFVHGIRPQSTKSQQAEIQTQMRPPSGFEAVDLNSETTSNQPTSQAEERIDAGSKLL